MTVLADYVMLIELQSLIERGYELVSGGTENHLVLVNLRNKVKSVVLSFLVIFSSEKISLGSAILLIHACK